ncbi:ADP-ribosyl-[dinitrogen reductase] hydrolase [Desulfosarcina ovata]|uniref:ADP-ribosyl-[dinitrogen reductase] hydrolase n=2 Tax=Desulfosarcina ovata TaxID=83564 RepID=A0A5K8AKW2_9BACT|nr:ADP-ribosyl-[dinitrogen reductase] hydrolase [Desulfosarcina ovata]BBO85317.1 ADP-ribosyl-[dinitrogen reductase] hydrolase [Desulfosarcina ovata subsp. sediminis]BBO92214.1 ADP-ribosyl-[dinitrogen reductase] hydrolase [Desulfosarcina ovata subsp. ovata]
MPVEFSPEHWQTIEQRGRAAFLGMAIGDALGATTEFMTPMEIRFKYGVHKKIVGGGWLYLKAGRVTDDTEMSVCIARAIRDAGGWDLTAIAQNFVDWMKSRPVDIGATCARGIREFMHTGSLEMPPNEWDAGNGAVMRMVPVALASLGDEKRLAEWSVAQAHLTHHHPMSDAACITVGRMVHQAMQGASLDQLQTLADELVGQFAKFRYRPYLGGSSAYVVDTMQTVFHYLFSTESFADCLIGVVNQGGDADTTGAIAGMIAGAFYGLSSFPRRWVRRLDPLVREEVTELADHLVNHSPLASRLK